MKRIGIPVLAALLLALGATGAARAQVYDPLESVNRVIFNINDALDRDVVRPIAKAYVDIVPGLVRTGVVEATSGGIFEALSRAIFLNCILAFFNLIPSPPLDGGTVIEWILPTRLLPQWQNISRYGFFIVMAFMVIPQLRWLYVAPAQHLYWAWAGGVLGLPVMR